MLLRRSGVGVGVGVGVASDGVIHVQTTSFSPRHVQMDIQLGKRCSGIHVACLTTQM